MLMLNQMHHGVYEVIDELPSLPNLTHLGGLSQTTEYLAPKCIRLFDKLGQFPSLKYLEVFIGYKFIWAS
jgi:hypothetical protein